MISLIQLFVDKNIGKIAYRYNWSLIIDKYEKFLSFAFKKDKIKI